MLNRVLNHLSALVAIDTTNPPRRIGADGGVVGYVADALKNAGLAVRIDDLGDGCVNVIATRGLTDLLLQCHLDTVPADPAWERDPFALSVTDGRAVGLGACDVKGSAACILAALEQTDAPASVLFTTDEEAGKSRCVQTFLESVEAGASTRPGIVLVCEPTGCAAVTTHRGIGVMEIDFAGVAAHTSQTGATDSNALHRAVLWGAQAISAAENGPLADCRLNIGAASGGVKANIAAPSATLTVGVRPGGGVDPARLISAFVALAPAEWISEQRVRFVAPGLAEDAHAIDQINAFGLTTGGGVDFWTEAALFGARGVPAFVFGPGSIAQAHAAGEFVEIAQLERAAATLIDCIEKAAQREAAHA